MRIRVYNLLLGYSKDNNVTFKNVYSDRFEFCSGIGCNKCTVLIKCKSLGANPDISKAQMNKFKKQFPEEFI